MIKQTHVLRFHAVLALCLAMLCALPAGVQATSGFLKGGIDGRGSSDIELTVLTDPSGAEVPPGSKIGLEWLSGIPADCTGYRWAVLHQAYSGQRFELSATRQFKLTYRKHVGGRRTNVTVLRGQLEGDGFTATGSLRLHGWLPDGSHRFSYCKTRTLSWSAERWDPPSLLWSYPAAWR
jgi:hypothetical protein